MVKIPPAAVKGESVTLECVTSSLGEIHNDIFHCCRLHRVLSIKLHWT